MTQFILHTRNVKSEIFTLDNLCSKVLSLGQYKLVNSNFQLITEDTYDDITVLTEGVYIVESTSETGLVNSFGKAIIPCNSNQNFSIIDKNRILVKKNNLQGIIDVEGKEIIPVEYSNIELLPNKNYKVTKDSYAERKIGVITANGVSIAECKFNEIITNETGEIVPSFTKVDDHFFCARMFDKYAVADNNKIILTEYEYDTISIFDDACCCATKEQKNCLVNKDGMVIFSVIDQNIESRIEDNLFIVRNYEKKGLTKIDGSIIIPCEYNEISQIEDKFIKVSKISFYMPLYGIFELSGTCIIPCEYSTIERLPNDNWKLSKNNRYGMCDPQGNMLHECQFVELIIDESGNVVPSYLDNNGVIFASRLYDKFALCNTEKQLISEYLYDSINSFENGLYLIEISNKQGLIDSTGKNVLELNEFNLRRIINENRFIASLPYTNTLGIIDKDGQIVIPFEYNEINHLDNGGFIAKKSIYTNNLFNEDGYLIFTAEEDLVFDDNQQLIITTIVDESDVCIKACCGKYAISNSSDISLDKFRFDRIILLDRNIFDVFIVKQGKNYGLANSKGEEVLPTEYSQEFSVLSEGLIQFRTNDFKYGICDHKGKIIAEAKYSFIRENSPGHLKLFWQDGFEKKSKFLNVVEPQKFEKNKTYPGIVCGVKPFGIFVKVRGYGSGLVHINKLIEQGKTISLFSQGDKVNVKVIKIRPDGKVEFTLCKNV